MSMPQLSHVYAWCRELDRQTRVAKYRRGLQIDPQTRERWHDAFGSRATNAFTDQGIITDDEVARMSDSELLRLPNFGKISLAIVRESVPRPSGTVCPRCGHFWKA